MIDKKKLYSTAVKAETAVLVAVSTQKQPAEKTREYLDELAFLATTLGVETIKTFTQNLERADIRTYRQGQAGGDPDVCHCNAGGYDHL